MVMPLVGTIIPWSAIYVPDGWLKCDGRMLAIEDYQVLYSLIGITYGGDGRVNFALPDFTTCVPIGAGNTQIGTLYLGQTIGYETEILSVEVSSMGAHSHSLSNLDVNIEAKPVEVTFEASKDLGERSIPQENDYISGIPAISGRPVSLYRDTMGTKVNLSGVSGNIPSTSAIVSGEVTAVGKAAPVYLTNVQPVLGFDFIIAYDGIYPKRK